MKLRPSNLANSRRNSLDNVLEQCDRLLPKHSQAEINCLSISFVKYLSRQKTIILQAEPKKQCWKICQMNINCQRLLGKCDIRVTFIINSIKTYRVLFLFSSI